MSRERHRQRMENSILARRYWHSLSIEDKIRIKKLIEKLRKETLVEEAKRNS